MTLQRIEKAIIRLEAVARRPASGDLALMEESNARLREAVALSLRQIDSLIARKPADLQG